MHPIICHIGEMRIEQENQSDFFERQTFADTRVDYCCTPIPAIR
jgi:hypothetical protein